MGYIPLSTWTASKRVNYKRCRVSGTDFPQSNLEMSIGEGASFLLAGGIWHVRDLRMAVEQVADQDASC